MEAYDKAAHPKGMAGTGAGWPEHPHYRKPHMNKQNVTLAAQHGSTTNG